MSLLIVALKNLKSKINNIIRCNFKILRAYCRLEGVGGGVDKTTEWGGGVGKRKSHSLS